MRAGADHAFGAEGRVRESAGDVLLAATGIVKSYGATRVLRGVDLTIRSGQIHALLGGNGAGKSTLIRVITGLTPRDGGEIVQSSGRPGRATPTVAVVHQELSLLPDLSVAENIGLVHAPRGLSLSSQRVMRTIGAEALKLIDPSMVPILNRPAGALSLHEGQIVEIARALSTGAEILLLDEPTANLTSGETAQLFAVLRRLAHEEGIGIVFVSHRMKEIRALCDVCTILRDGATVENARPLASLSDADIVGQMGQPAQRAAAATRRWHSQSLSPSVRLDGPAGTAIEIAPGTILGFAGAPAGPTGLIATLVGASREGEWRLSIDGRERRFASPAEAVRSGIGFISGDRAAKGILAKLPIVDNVLAGRRVRERRRLVREDERGECASLVSALKLKAGSIWDAPASLSGGNQQKLLVARWLGLKLRMVVLEEPTRGVDIGTKRDIYDLIRRMADDGAIVVWWSTENVELLELCDRIFAFDPEGRPCGFLSEARRSEDGIAELKGMEA